MVDIGTAALTRLSGGRQ